jgi:hypothetical protein
MGYAQGGGGTMKEGVQDMIATIGESGCYTLTLCQAASLSCGMQWSMGESVCDIERGIQSGRIKSDMTVLDGATFMYDMTGRHWTKEYKDAGYKPKEGDYLIAEWFNKRTGKTHFTLEYPEKWNSLSDSVTVKEGYIKSYRLYREVK